MNKRIAAVGGVALVAVAAGGLWGYPALQEWLFQKKLNAALVRHHKVAVDKAKLVEDQDELRDYQTWYVDSMQKVLAEHRPEAPPNGQALIAALSGVAQEVQRFTDECFLARQVLDEVLSVEPGVLALSPDGRQRLAQFDAAVDLYVNLDERVNQSRENARRTIAGSGANEAARIALWQTLQWSHERLGRSLRARQRPAGNLKAYSRLAHYLLDHKDSFYVANNGMLMFGSSEAAGEYNKLVFEVRRGL